MAKKFDLGESMPETIDTISTPETVADGVEPVVDTTTNGLDDNERKDPNSIAVTIADKETPIVVLFGPAACGKTMTLVRLTRLSVQVIQTGKGRSLCKDVRGVQHACLLQ